MPGARVARMLMILVALVVVAGLLLGMVAAPGAV
jgi:phosphotransferase system  glucose/maltose/N-acetylglucosamine-specific IIC component